VEIGQALANPNDEVYWQVDIIFVKAMLVQSIARIACSQFFNTSTN